MGSCTSVHVPQWAGYDAQLLRDTSQQSICIEQTEEKGASAIRRCKSAKDGFQMYLTDEATKVEMHTGWAICKVALEKYKDLKCFGYRPFTDPEKNTSSRGAYQFDTYDTVGKQILAAGNGLRALGIEKDANIGIFSINRAEWVTVHLANWSQSFRTVALYDTLGAQAVQYIVWHAELSAIYVEKDKLPQLFEAIESCSSDKELKLKYIIQFDHQPKYNNKHEAVDESDVVKAKELGVELIAFTDLMNKGGDKTETDEPSSDDLAYIMYTSGTTGDPKGVMLTHQCFAAAVATAFRRLSEHGIPMNSSDHHVSYLPLAHIFESVVVTIGVAVGMSIAFHQGDIKKISDDWKEIRPTIMFGVPRIYSKTYDKVKLKIAAAGGAKEWLFNKGWTASQQAVRQNGRRAGFYDSLLWSKVAAEIGFDRVKFILSGAAPLPPHVAEFLKIACPNAAVLQGYGLTETCAASFVTSATDHNLGHVGVPVDNLEYRLVDAPECDYHVTDKPHPRGEIQMRGPTVMNGYYKNDEATKKCLSEDGWFSTGDIGRINPNGTLSIIDRRKNMFKTAMGEYIAAEKVENVYSKAAVVNQIWIYGNSFKSFVVAVVVPDPLWLVPVLTEKGLWKDTEGLVPASKGYCEKYAAVCGENYDVVKEIVVKNINQVEKESDLKRFEMVKDYYVECDVDNLLQGFNVENNCLTPTFKLKRPQLLNRYKDVIKKMYADNGEPAKQDEHW